MANAQAPRHALRWLPPFVVGLCAAACAEVALGLLLYAGPGLIRSLTTILVVEATALGVGLWTAPTARPDLIDALRRRWLLLLVAVLLATLFSAFWTVVASVGGDGVGQGLGLAVLAALPMYACGGVLGGMASVEAPSGRRSGVGPAAVLGAATGFAVTGLSLPQLPTPASLLLVCLVLLSVGGLVYGSVLDTRLRVHVRARRQSPMGEVRVEDRYLLSKERSVRLLLEGEHVRGYTVVGEPGSDPWDVSVYRGLSEGGGPGRVLLVGGGVSSLPRAAVGGDPEVQVDVIERTPPVVELGRDHMETGLRDEPDSRVSLHVGNIEDVLESLEGPYDLLLIDTSAMAPAGGVAGLSRRIRQVMWTRLSPEGVIGLGSFDPGPGAWSFPDGADVAHFERSLDSDFTGLDVGLPGSETLTLGRLAGSTAPWPERIGDFTRTAST